MTEFKEWQAKLKLTESELESAKSYKEINRLSWKLEEIKEDGMQIHKLYEKWNDEADERQRRLEREEREELEQNIMEWQRVRVWNQEE